MRRDNKIIHRRTQMRIQPLVNQPFVHVADSVFTLLQAGGNLVPMIAERRYAFHTGNDYALAHTMPPLMEITWRVT